MNLIIKKDAVRLDTASPRRHTESGHAHKRGARLLSIAGEARAIEVSCECGETFVIELDFEGKTA